MHLSFCRAVTAGLLLIFLPVAAIASTNSAWSVHVWQSSDGLPNNAVTGIAQTDDGFLWVANPSHLAQFDGVDFKGIPLQSLIPDNYQETTSLLRGRDGGLWIGMNRGAVMYLKDKLLKAYTNGLPAQYVQTFVEDSEGAVWVTCRGGFVCRIKDDVMTHFDGTDGLPTGYECFFAQGRDGHFWFGGGTNAGIYQAGILKTIAQAPRT